jgi:hypothetical protein
VPIKEVDNGRAEQVKRVGKQMTTQQVAPAKKLLEGRTIRETVRKVGLSEKQLARLGPRKREAIQLKASELLDDGGLKLEDFIKNHLIPQLSATKRKVIRYKGKITEVNEIPDRRARLRALRTIFFGCTALSPQEIPTLMSRKICGLLSLIFPGRPVNLINLSTFYPHHRLRVGLALERLPSLFVTRRKYFWS